MLLKFAFQDFFDDTRFKNTTQKNIETIKPCLVSLWSLFVIGGHFAMEIKGLVKVMISLPHALTK
ncbi:hypothetical protein C1I60_12355 [Paenibacillus terrae]|uniref:Uncharacterized protein n=1 Tax=Paenibacillus terrae TaxID=159743 RepID=A0A4V6X2N7_9BACL|nr:hypothetical protein [Paenibacillus terrae]TKH44131.1 hypothetical protein C1I60_12355 [Paenibacillus terrae]